MDGMDGDCINLGCTTPSACNFSPGAEFDDGSCEFLSCAGCTDPSYVEYDPEAILDDGTCVMLVIYGCMDTDGCNYDPAANVNEGCAYPTVFFLDFDGDGLGQSDLTLEACSIPDGASPIPGDLCDDPSACNFSDFFNAPCTYPYSQFPDNDGDGLGDVNGQTSACSPLPGYVSNAWDGCDDPAACNATYSNNGNCTYVEDAIGVCGGSCTVDLDGDGICDSEEIQGCTDPAASNYSSLATDDDGSCQLGNAPSNFSFTASPNAASLVCQVTHEGAPPPAGSWVGAFDAAGSCAGAAEVISYGDSIYCHLVIYGADAGGAGLSEGDPFTLRLYRQDLNNQYVWLLGDTLNFSQVWSNLNGGNLLPSGNILPVEFSGETTGCADASFIEFIPDVDWISSDCNTPIVSGCTDPDFIEFSGDANVDDGSCSVPAVGGCTDVDYLEFNPDANVDDGSCTVVAIGGCTDPDFIEFNASANLDDGSCTVLVVFGCTDDGFVEFNDAANLDDGSCTTVAVPGCIYSSYLEFDPGANVDDGSCLTPVIDGCTDPEFLEFNPSANLDNGSCNTPVLGGCTDPDFLEFDLLSNLDDGSCTTPAVDGCLDLAACNFQAEANREDGSCTYPVDWYYDEDGDGLGRPDSVLTACEMPGGFSVLGTDGCDDTLACNFTEPTASICAYPSLFYPDTDGDGLGAAVEATVACVAPEGMVSSTGDLCEDITACNHYGVAGVICRYEDAIGQCGGTCTEDSNANGICDTDEDHGCTDTDAINFDPYADIDDGSCVGSDPPFGFDFTVTPQASTLLGIAATGSLSPSAGDWVLARTMNGTPCGLTQLTTTAAPYFNLTLYGDDPTTSNTVEGLEEGGAFTLHLYDSDQLTEYASVDGGDTLSYGPWTATNGAHLPDIAPLAQYTFEVRIFGCTDSSFQEFNAFATDDDGSCLSPLTEGCTDPEFIEFDPEATVDDGSCLIPVQPGCTDDGYTEFNPSANVDDGSCSTPGVGGCTNPYFLEFDATVDFDDGSCSTFIYSGCTDDAYLEYDPLATVDDGSCTIPAIPGCTEPEFLEFNAVATIDDGSCLTIAVEGCTNVGACNYNPEANLPNGSCILPTLWYPDEDGDGLGRPDASIPACAPPDGFVGNSLDGCDDPAACNFQLPWASACITPDLYFADPDFDGLGDAADSILSCVPVIGYATIPGDICSDLDACNYDAPDNAPCIFPDAIGTCGGGCEEDLNDNGVCDPDEIPGCMDPAALNYAPEANIPGVPCIVFDEDTPLPDIAFSPLSATFYGTITIDGMSAASTDVLLAFDTTGQCIGTGYLVPLGTNTITALTLYGDDPTSPDTDEGAEEGEPFLLGLYRTTEDHLYPYPSFDGPELLYSWSNQNGGGLPGFSDWTTFYDFSGTRAGCTDPAFLEYDPDAEVDDGSCVQPVISGCTDPDYLEFDPQANVDDASCLTPVVLGCTSALFYDFDPEANVDDGSCQDPIPQGCTDADFVEFDPGAALDDGSCQTPVVLGCTNPAFLEFDAAANTDDGSCSVPVIMGCTDPAACNHQITANVEDGSCDYPEFGYDCFGNCVQDADGDGVCNPFEIPGCTYANACNYNPAATDDNGSCVFAAPGEPCPEGCTSDTDGDGICDADEVPGCQQEDALNFNPIATDPDACLYPSACPPDIDEDGLVGVSDILSLLTAFGFTCDYFSGPCPSDIDANGVVTIADLIQLLTDFGNNCTTQ